MAQDGAFFAAALSASGVGIPGVERLAADTGGARGAWEADAEILRRHLDEKAVAALLKLRREKPQLPEQIAEACAKLGVSIWTRDDDEYPPILREIARPPLALFARGTSVPDAERIAVVGSRHASPYGRRVSEELAMGLAARGVTVVSGAARGVDSAAHTGALRSGRTVAVLGCESPPGTRPVAAFFPQRNRIISGLSRGTLVVEAAERSGSLITAELALSEGRDVFAVPGGIYSDTSRGCHRLIQQGAKLVTSAADVLDEYPWAKRESPRKKSGGSSANETTPENLSAEERAVYAILSKADPLSVDDIVYRLHGRGDASNVAFLLLQMQLKGAILEDGNHAYTRA